jgi:hypothetical protein
MAYIDLLLCNLQLDNHYIIGMWCPLYLFAGTYYCADPTYTINVPSTFTSQRHEHSNTFDKVAHSIEHHGISMLKDGVHLQHNNYVNNNSSSFLNNMDVNMNLG